MMASKVLVTGGTGYVAGWCIATLLERGFVTWTGPSLALRDDLTLRRKMLWM